MPDQTPKQRQHDRSVRRLRLIPNLVAATRLLEHVSRQATDWFNDKDDELSAKDAFKPSAPLR